jgi:hypothetical protein
MSINHDDFVKSQKFIGIVIPVKTGIKGFQSVMNYNIFPDHSLVPTQKAARLINIVICAISKYV